MNEKEQIFGILCETVDRLRSKKEYDIIESLYNNLLKCDLIHSIEDFKAGKVIKGSMEEALIYWIWRALVQAESNQILNLLIPDEIMYDIFPVIEKANIVRTDEEILSLFKDSNEEEETIPLDF